MKKVDDITFLCKKIAADDQLAYRQLYLQFYNKLYRFVLGFTKNKELSEEIVSDVFINVWRKRATIETIVNLKLYLYVSAKNIAFNYLKKLHREKMEELEEVEIEPEAPFSDPSEALITREMNLKIKAAINELPPKCKLIFVLVKEDGLSYKQAAKLLNLSVSTIDNQLTIALKKIAGSMKYSFHRQ